MSTASVSSKIQMGIDVDVMESLKVYSDKHGITVEEAANYIIQNFLSEEGSMNIEHGCMIVLDDDVYDRLEAEFKAGLDSVRTESDWISEREMREFANSLRLN